MPPKKGIKFSEEHKHKISKALKNRKRSAQHCLNLSKAHRERGTSCGDKNWGWKGGIYTDKMGYIYIHSPAHPRRDSRNYIPMHRFVMEKHIGRYVEHGEVVHHIDSDRGNNKLENLILLPNQKAHSQFHKWGRKKHV